MTAFRAAQDAGADGIETDLRDTADGRIALYHDDTVRGVPVEEMSLAELRRATARDVPELDDVLSLEWRLRWNLEIKTRRAGELAFERLSRLPAGTLVTSFIHDAVIPFACGGVECGILTASHPSGPPPGSSPPLSTCVLDARILDADSAAAWHAAGWRLATYATSGERRHRAAVALGADIVITDEVRLMMALSRLIPS